MIENIFKSWFTTLLGCVIMGASFYMWYNKEITWQEAGGGGLFGFALLFMKDKIPDFISRFGDKILGKKDGTPNP